MPAAIQIADLSKRFGATQALAGVDLCVPEGTVLGLLGPNGAGKTTLVRILATLLQADAGEARVGGFDVRTQAHQVRELIGLTGQYASVDEKLTGRENLILIARLLGFSRADARDRTRSLLEQFHLLDAAHRAAKTYSGGMRRRLDLAASLVGRPRILFLDEPTTGLDPRARLDLWQLVRGLVGEGTTVLLTTQYLDEADALANEIAIIDQGRVIASGTAQSLKARVGHRNLEVVVRERDDIARVAAWVSRITGRPADIKGQRVSAPAADPEHLPALVRALDEAGVPVDELALRGASLDDVFLSLTGRRAGPGPDDAEESA
ncbi:ATP-binding cassette domain-containing protein [Ectothiorhodospira shaposhnikovii]|uniref:ATP-binding cassette domain-containing protein n=1 Tax=Ectothiorhodospira shaposhnikovii TaxID=1054 RepID=UPI001EE7D0FA|nr:ATP-binding cassette domain-containing protein [Ectothiorhodospira shaposhnikovii]MCG5513513.1 ATP-binding cassette domain-containing protein [Ectothiorhodospira shaposhnikovii]